jgi:hypothetical protein
MDLDRLNALNDWFSRQGWRNGPLSLASASKATLVTSYLHPVLFVCNHFRLEYRYRTDPDLEENCSLAVFDRLVAALVEIGYDINEVPDEYNCGGNVACFGKSALVEASPLPAGFLRCLLGHGANPNQVVSVGANQNRDGSGALLPWLFIDIIEEDNTNPHIESVLDVLDEFGQDWNLLVNAEGTLPLMECLNMLRQDTLGFSGDRKSIQDFMIDDIQKRQILRARADLTAVIAPAPALAPSRTGLRL